jgi:hypothetical protein
LASRIELSTGITFFEGEGVGRGEERRRKEGREGVGREEERRRGHVTLITEESLQIMAWYRTAYYTVFDMDIRHYYAYVLLSANCTEPTLDNGVE